MSERITWSVNVTVSSGPRLSVSSHLNVDAYDKLTLSLDAGVTDVDVDLQPGAAENVQFLMIKATPSDAQVTYTVAGSSTVRALDGPHFLVGTGAVGLLGADPTQLTMSNGTSDPVMIEVIVGRSAT